MGVPPRTECRNVLLLWIRLCDLLDLRGGIWPHRATRGEGKRRALLRPLASAWVTGLQIGRAIVMLNLLKWHKVRHGLRENLKTKPAPLALSQFAELPRNRTPPQSVQ